MTRPASPRSGQPRGTRPRQRAIAGAAFLAVAGLGASYLQALRSPSAYASTTCSAVTSSASTLTAAIDEVNAGTCDTIEWEAFANTQLISTTVLPVIDLASLSGAQHLTLDGNKGSLRGVGTWGEAGFVIEMGADDELTISNLTIQSINSHTRTDPNGGALNIHAEDSGSSQAQVHLYNLTLGTAADKGGAVYVTHANVTIEDSAFINAVAYSAGGSIYALDSDLTVTRTAFINGNVRGSRATMEGDGGGIFIKDGTLDIQSSSFYGMSAYYDGGAVYSDNADLTMTNVFVGGGTASEGGGGGIYIKNAAVSITSSSFVNNSSNGDVNRQPPAPLGSGIHIESPDDLVTMTGVLITTTDDAQNCDVNADGLTVSYSVSSDGSCSFNDNDAHSADETAIALEEVTGGDRHWDCGITYLKSRMPSSGSWPVVHAPSSAPGVTEDLWGVSRSGTFTIGARQYIAPPSFTAPTTDAYPDGLTGENYTSQTALAVNGPHIVYAATGLPPGLNVNPCTGVLGGRPTTAGSYSTVITARGAGGITSSVTQSIRISVNPIPVFTGGPTTTGSVGVPYSSAFTATGDPTPTFSLYTSFGPLPQPPPGLTMNSDGTLTGTPTTEGSYTFTARAQNARSTGLSPITRQVTIQIRKLPPVFTSENASSPVTFGDPYSYTYAASGTPVITFALAPGSQPWPPGLSLNSSTGKLSGTPTATGTYTFTVRATNDAGFDTTLSQTIVVRPDLPDAPIVTTKVRDTALDLTWSRPAYQGSSPILKYKIVATPSGKTCQVDATSATTYTCTLTGLKNGTTYTLKAQSFSSVGWSTASTSQAIPCTVPSMPRNIKVVSKSADGTLTIEWDAPTSDGGARIQGYVVFWRLRDDLIYTQMPSVSVMNRTITKLKAGSTYRIAVAARNSAGRSDTKTFIIVKIPKS